MIKLVIVDCQVDFISGSMTVSGSKKAIRNIINYINKHHKEISQIIFTLDWHPFNHCSFKENGGQWATHCVKYTSGAGIDYSLLKTVADNNLRYKVFKKGVQPSLEEYGAFSKGFHYVSGGTFHAVQGIKFDPSDAVVVCGIAGDYCVKETINNLCTIGNIIPKVLLSGIASIDDGSTIDKVIKNLKLNIVQ